MTAPLGSGNCRFSGAHGISTGRGTPWISLRESQAGHAVRPSPRGSGGAPAAARRPPNGTGTNLRPRHSPERPWPLGQSCHGNTPPPRCQSLSHGAGDRAGTAERAVAEGNDPLSLVRGGRKVKEHQGVPERDWWNQALTSLKWKQERPPEKTHNHASPPFLNTLSLRG